jgi:hypothetical protein
MDILEGPGELSIATGYDFWLGNRFVSTPQCLDWLWDIKDVVLGGY